MRNQVPERPILGAWRYEYSNGAVGPYSLTVAAGETTMYTRIVPLTEVSHLRCRWKAAYDAVASLALNIYVDTVLLDSSWVSGAAAHQQTGIAEDILLNHAASNATVEFKVTATGNTIPLCYYKCSIDVCRV